ncbi:MAG: 3-deoxy-manno-octulosonate cytidylyltransferase [Bacteroidales bacterium]|nr:3-deoxy-manno-octulosonate cytidylyltransferase [Bacteroidales bacterium]
MKILGVIPARYASTRFPGKPLAVINGTSMIRRVYEQSIKCDHLETVMVATDNEQIRDHVRSFGGNVMMTEVTHTSGTERCAEVLENLRRESEVYDCLINIQGDEPYIDPRQINQVAECFINPKTQLATLIKKISSREELSSQNVVKVVVDNQGYALLFSRAMIPFFRGKDQNEWLSATNYYKHIGIYGYRASVLEKIVSLPVSELEKAESLEQLRWLENGYRIMTQITEFESCAIDTPADLLKITNSSGAAKQ